MQNYKQLYRFKWNNLTYLDYEDDCFNNKECDFKVKNSLVRVRYNPVMSDKKKGEGGWKPTQKLSLLQLVETEQKIFSTYTIRGLLLKLKRRARSPNN